MLGSSREHYIPLRRSDLVNLLAGDATLSAADAEAFRRFCDILSATFHFEYKRLHDSLKDAYAPFDPESTTHAQPLTDEQRHVVLDELFIRVDELLRRANFRPLGAGDLAEASKLRSDWGINMDVDVKAFERYQLYFRGDTIGQRARRGRIKFWQTEVVDVPVYQRLALIIKLKKHKRFPASVDTNDVFLKYFKDIPQADIEMLLPGARMLMPGSHRLKLGGSIVSGLAILGYNVFKQLLNTAIFGVAYLWGMLFALFGYGWRQYAGYQSARYACSLRLTESLYFQTLANNSGVLFSLLDEAEEQDSREAILAYFFLWRHAPAAGMTAQELDIDIERDIEVRTGLPIDFEIDDALAKLERLGLVTASNGRYVAAPIDAAKVLLDRAWDGQFSYHQPEAA